MVINPGVTSIDFTDEFNAVADSLTAELNSWNDAQCRHNAIIKADRRAAFKLKAMAEMLINCANKALENE